MLLALRCPHTRLIMGGERCSAVLAPVYGLDTSRAPSGGVSKRCQKPAPNCSALLRPCLEARSSASVAGSPPPHATRYGKPSLIRSELLRPCVDVGRILGGRFPRPHSLLAFRQSLQTPALNCSELLR